MKHLVALTLAAIAPLASHAKSWTDFCAELKNWEPGVTVPPDSEYEDLAQVVSAEFVKEKWDAAKQNHASKESWLIIDVRSKPDLVVGTIPRTLFLRADFREPQSNEFTAKAVLEKTNAALKSNFRSLQEMKNVHFIVFCNGNKCHRSTYAACELRRGGIAKTNIHLFPGGLPAWQAKGYPIK